MSGEAPPEDLLHPAVGGRCLIVTGAGVSEESGLPTFRGAGGHWRRHDPAKLATPEAFASDPALVWEWYTERRRALVEAQPNAAHAALVRLAAGCAEFLLVTQNVDDLHERAGTPAHALVHVHGRLLSDRCTRCPWRGDAAPPFEPMRRCPSCGALLRPDVTWFGEALDPAAVGRVEEFLDGGRCDLVLVIGTTAAFGYVVDWALRGAAGGGRLVEVNPEPTFLSPLAYASVRRRAAEVLPALVDAVA